jgi:hypothetical protein
MDAKGHKVAVVHQYVRRDGSLGGSGNPDPKMLLEAGNLYRVLRPGTDDAEEA